MPNVNKYQFSSSYFNNIPKPKLIPCQVSQLFSSSWTEAVTTSRNFTLNTSTKKFVTDEALQQILTEGVPKYSDKVNEWSLQNVSVKEPFISGNFLLSISSSKSVYNPPSLQKILIIHKFITIKAKKNCYKLLRFI